MEGRLLRLSGKTQMKPFRHGSVLLATVLIAPALCCCQERSRFAVAIPDWKVRPAKSVSLLLAFDTDPSLNRMSYWKFSDHDIAEFFPQSQRRYQTLMWTRSGGSVRLVVDLPIVACPRRQGFLYAGFAGYAKTPHPAKLKWWCDKDCPPSFADCGEVWQTSDPSQIEQAIAQVKVKLAAGPCGKTDEDDSNITDDRRISFITPKVLSIEGLKAEVTGGAAYVNAEEYAYELSLDSESDLRLSDILPKSAINHAFQSRFLQEHWTPFWGNAEGALDHFDFSRYADFTFLHAGSATHLIGLHSAAGNAEHQFLAMVDLGTAPASFVNHPDSGLDFSEFAKIDPKVLAVFGSPDRATIFVLTADRMIAIDTKTKRELYNFEHGIKFNKVIMAEWALGDNNVRHWDRVLNGVGSQLPPLARARVQP